MKIKLKFPLNYNKLSNEHQDYFIGSFVYKAQPVKKIKNAFITNNGIVLKGLRYVNESCYEPSTYRKKYWFYAFKRKILSKVSRWGKDHLFVYSQKDPVGIIHQPYINYFHFTIESLTRWVLLTNNTSDAKVLIPEELVRIPYIDEWLNLLKIDIIIVPESCNIKANQLLLPTIVRWAGNHDANIVKELRNRSLEAISKIERNTISSPTKIFIVRKGRRQIKNILEIENCLQKYGITFIDFDGMSVIEQLQVVSDAELIIGQHGAGLTNVIFAKENCSVVEIFIDPKEVNGIIDDEYYRIFNLLNFDYYCLFAKKANENGDFFTSDVTLDINDIETLLTEYSLV
jgi:hypothetical protein